MIFQTKLSFFVDKSNWMVFILVFFNVSLDQQDSRICVALRAAEWSFIFVLIFMYLQSSKFADLELHWEQLKCFICLKIFHFGPDFHVSLDRQIFRVFHFGSDFHIPRFRVPLRAAELVFILVLIFMHLQILKFADL